MKKIIVILAFIALFTSFFVSCGSTPGPDSKTVDPHGEQSLDEENLSEEVNEPAPSAPTEDEDANSPVDIAAENQEALEKAELARQTAIDAGADKAFPEKFAEIDALYEAAKEKANAGENASSELDKIGRLYSALEQYSLAVEAKNRIDENNFAEYDKTSYNKGCDFLSKTDEILQEPFETADEILASATSAYGQFKNVIFEAYRKRSREERTNAFIAKRNADAVRAGVASKEAYNAAVEEFRKGDSAYSMQNPESAYGHYVAAKEQFTSVYDIVSERRAQTEKAMLDSQKKVEDAYSYAQNADKNSPLEGDDIEGIENPDAVLLESDSYENPESLEADIPEDIDALPEDAEEMQQEIDEAKTDTTQDIDTFEETDETDEVVEENTDTDASAENSEGSFEAVEENEATEENNKPEKVEPQEAEMMETVEAENAVETDEIEALSENAEATEAVDEAETSETNIESEESKSAEYDQYTAETEEQEEQAQTTESSEESATEEDRSLIETEETEVAEETEQIVPLEESVSPLLDETTDALDESATLEEPAKPIEAEVPATEESYIEEKNADKGELEESAENDEESSASAEIIEEPQTLDSMESSEHSPTDTITDDISLEETPERTENTEEIVEIETPVMEEE